MSIAGLILPNFILAQETIGASAPQTVGEAKDFITDIFQKLPEAVKKVWKEEALPLWQKMWQWVKPLMTPWFNKQVEKRRPGLEQEFQKEKTEMQNDIWQRFKELIRQSI